MRRALLTASVKIPGVVFGPGVFTGTSALVGGNTLVVQGGYTAPSTGVVTYISYGTTAAATLWVYTGVLVGSNFTIRDRASISADASGSQIASVSLTVVAGDCLARWSATGLSKEGVSGGPTFQYGSVASAPVSGSVSVPNAFSGTFQLSAIDM